MPNNTLDKDGDALTNEFAFFGKFSKRKFAKLGDSGGFVHSYDDKYENCEIVGMIFAIQEFAPFLTFVTPMSNILQDISAKHGISSLKFP